MPTPELHNAKVVLIVSGGIAAYKAAELVSRLRRAGAEVRVVMTAAARQFVAPLTFESLSGYPVYESVFERAASYEMEHISWARWADVVVAAPATANLLAKMAHGLADDAATTLLLACERPVWVAPAMNTAMWRHPATVDNLARLRRRGVRVLEPESGRLACGEVGEGRMAQPETIVATLAAALADASDRAVTPPAPQTRQSLAGRTVLITAGPTREALDPIRFVSNRSTGRMGAELAEAAVAQGARVIFIHGPLQVAVPAGVEAIAVESARQMLAAVQAHWERADLAVFAAAVANYESAAVADKKIKGGETLTLELRRTPDIAAWAGTHRRPGQVLVGFAAESTDLLAAARRKLAAKHLDLICANPIGEAGVGFEALQNRVILIPAAGDPVESPQASKAEVAAWIWDRVQDWQCRAAPAPRG